MNVILIERGELDARGVCVLEDRRSDHVRRVLGPVPGQKLKVGLLGGNLGYGEVLDLAPLRLRCVFELPPPPRTGLHVVLGMPRPLALKRILRQLAELGVESLDLTRAARTEKSYFQSPLLEDMESHLRLGLEQAVDTRLPRVSVHRRFRPFVEDWLPRHLPVRSLRFLADVEAKTPLADLVEAEAGLPVLIAIGPEGGWVPYECELLRAAGFRGVWLGARVLRVETALTYALAQVQCRRTGDT